MVKKASAKKAVRKGVGAKKVTKSRTATVAKSITPGRASAAKTAGVTKKTAKKPTSEGKPLVASKKTPPAPEEEKPVAAVPKTRLSPAELQEFKELLLAKRAELSGDVWNLSRETLDNRNSGGGTHSSMPIHMADLGSDNWEHEFTLGLIENEQVRIREIDEALDRIANETYGVCLATHKRISKARLRAKPWAKFCIEHARALEEGRVR